MSSSRRVGLLLGLAVLLALPACGGAPVAGDVVGPGVVFLGRREVDFKVDRDLIAVGRDTGRFTKLRFEVDRAPIAVYDLRVELGNGENYSPGTRLVFGEGTWSREIDLPGGTRYIKNLSFLYESVGAPKRGRAIVRVYGLR